MPSPSSTKRRWLRFSLATFFFISLTIGTIIAGYQSGYRRGYNSGQTIRLDETHRSEVYTTVLVIGTNLNSTERAAGIADLTDLITSTVRSDIWSPQSGNEIRDFPANDSIVITAPGYAHARSATSSCNWSGWQPAIQSTTCCPFFKAWIRKAKRSTT